MNNLFSLEGKVAIITGGNGVLGGAMAKGLAEAGARVGIMGRTKETVQNKVESINEQTGRQAAFPLVCDVLKTDNLQDIRKSVVKEHERIDILINAAGGNLPGATINPDQSFLDLDDVAFEKVLDLNFMGTYYPTKVFCEQMIQQKSGSIINISSMAATQAITRVMGYSAAKSAIDNFTKSLATEVALKYGDGIRVNGIAPGFFIGKQNKKLLLNDDGSLTDRGQTIVDNTPFGRFGEADELIGTAIWLCSDASSFVTGTVIPVDGGFSAFSGV
jgi:NAD(P)-dependent dehydrogenase (short-subunit alcohol dehydrogenase family)